MQLIQSPKFNRNYSAKIVTITSFSKHPNPKCERLKCCMIDGFQIAVGIDTLPGTHIYFPVECCINQEFLSANNLFRDANRNLDKDTNPGFFEDSCRVKIIRLQGYPSEGFVIPVNSLKIWLNEDIDVTQGTEFDSVNGNILCKKYTPTITLQHSNTVGKKKVKEVESRVIEDQFRFHYNTILIKKCPHVIHPDDLISITSKVHGTSGISAYVQCAKEIPWHSRVAAWVWNNIWNTLISLFSKGHWSFELNKTEYDYLWSSRSVVKNPFYNKNVTEGFYGVDVWKYADEIIRPYLAKGMTCYYEIIGFLPNGGYIQKGFDYGYFPSTDRYEYGKQFGIQIYRVTYTNPDGKVYEFSARQVQQWCLKCGLTPVEEYYYGYAKDLYPALDIQNHWNENFIAKLAVDKQFFMECDSPTCDNKVPHEGLVIKIENSLSEAYKLKCIKFLEGESKALDNEEINIESES